MYGTTRQKQSSMSESKIKLYLQIILFLKGLAYANDSGSILS